MAVLPGLRPGNMVLPASQTSARTSCGGVDPRYDPGVVYISSDPTWALVFALLRRNGMIYRVRPIGALGLDPTRQEDCYTCLKALVLGIGQVPPRVAEEWRIHRRPFIQRSSNAMDEYHWLASFVAK